MTKSNALVNIGMAREPSGSFWKMSCNCNKCSQNITHNFYGRKGTEGKCIRGERKKKERVRERHEIDKLD